MRTCAPLVLLGLCPKLKYPPLCGGIFILYRKYIREIVLSLHWENVDTYIAMCYHKLIEESK